MGVGVGLAAQKSYRRLHGFVNLNYLADMGNDSLAGLMKKHAFDFTLAGDSRTYGNMVSDEGLREIAIYAQAIGPWKEMIVAGKTISDLVARAHRHKLLVHPYTFRSDKEILPAQYSGDPNREYQLFYCLGVDGLFSDFADQAVSAREQWLKQRQCDF